MPSATSSLTPVTVTVWGAFQLSGVKVSEAGLDEVTIGIRPESLEVSTDGGVDVVVDLVEDLGSEAYVYTHAGSGIEFLIAQENVLLKGTSLLVLAGAVAMYMLEALIMVLQAYVFTLLTAIYIEGALHADSH